MHLNLLIKQLQTFRLTFEKFSSVEHDKWPRWVIDQKEKYCRKKRKLSGNFDNTNCFHQWYTKILNHPCVAPIDLKPVLSLFVLMNFLNINNQHKTHCFYL